MNGNARRTLTLAAATALAGAALAATPAFADSASAGSAAAQPQVIVGGGGDGSGGCVDGDGNDCLYYSANGTGSRVALTGTINCYDNCGGSNYFFDDTTAGSAGLGDIVRNDAHYVYNNNSTHPIRIFVYPNEQGPQDSFDEDHGPGVGYNFGNLTLTLNNNASQDMND